MINAKKKLGKLGELMAAHFLIAKGYKILDQNFYIQGAEIDLVCEDKNEIVFVEVKTRTNKRFGDIIEAMTQWKLKKIEFAANVYLARRKLEKNDFRIDFVGVDLTANHPQIEHIEAIF